MIESNSEATKMSVTGMKTDIARLQDENRALKQQLADLQTAFNNAEAAHAKERQVLLDEVAKMVASGKGSETKTTKKKEPTPQSKPTPEPEKIASHNETPPAVNSPPIDTTTSTATTTPPPDASPAKPQKGYYHVVETGETLSLISSAYRQQGINVSIPEIEKANGLTDKSMLKVGQKLFIPKPGT